MQLSGITWLFAILTGVLFALKGFLFAADNFPDSGFHWNGAIGLACSRCLSYLGIGAGSAALLTTHDRRVMRSSGNKDDGEKLDAVAHGQHGDAAIVVAFHVRRLKIVRHLIAAKFHRRGLRGLPAGNSDAAP